MPFCCLTRLAGICRAGLRSRRMSALVALPAKCPELNAQENVWQFMRDNWLSNRIFKSYDDIVDHCCHAWNKLVDQPWRIIDLVQWLWDEFEVSISKQALGHELRTMGYRKLSARPRHRGQRSDDIVVFKKSSPPVWRKSARAFPKERS